MTFKKYFPKSGTAKKQTNDKWFLLEFGKADFVTITIDMQTTETEPCSGEEIRHNSI